MLGLPAGDASPAHLEREAWMRKTMVRKTITLALLMTGVSAAPALAQDPMGDADRGRALAEQVCAVCHAVQPGERDSPVSGLASFQAAAERKEMSEVGLRVFLRSSHQDMPNLVLTPEEIDDLVAYIHGLRVD